MLSNGTTQERDTKIFVDSYISAEYHSTLQR